MTSLTISSRTPEGEPSRCILCDHQTNLEYSSPTDDAPCPSCGHLLWRSSQTFQIVQNQLAKSLHIDSSQITPSFPLPSESDSLNTVEMVMELEEALEVGLSQEIITQSKNVADLTRQILAVQRERSAKAPSRNSQKKQHDDS